VQAIRSVAHALGKEVIAEAVETAAVANTLRDLQIEYGQGFFLGRPGPTFETGGVRAPKRRSLKGKTILVASPLPDLCN
jgi:EAL domain-containing protein (putative c-di-GMP-specific phosphodiesterase class I)